MRGSSLSSFVKLWFISCITIFFSKTFGLVLSTKKTKHVFSDGRAKNMPDVGGLNLLNIKNFELYSLYRRASPLSWKLIILLSDFQDFFLFERIAFNKFLVGISYCSLWKDILKSRIELINLEHVFWHFNIINDADSECLFFLPVDLYLLSHTIIAQKKICFLSKENKFFTFPKIPARIFNIFCYKEEFINIFSP